MPQEDDDHVSRRHALECMIWTGSAILWSVSGGVPKSLSLLGRGCNRILLGRGARSPTTCTSGRPGAPSGSGDHCERSSSFCSAVVRRRGP